MDRDTSDWKPLKMVHGQATEYGWVPFWPAQISIGTGVDIGSGTRLFGHHGITIGDGAQIGGGCYLYSSDTEGGWAGPITIGQCANIGSGTRIFPNVTIGDGARIAAMSMVKAGTTIPPGELWAGCPAQPKHNIYVITGGTGSIGRMVVERLLLDDTIDAIRVYSRDEAKQAAMQAELERTHSGYDCTRIRYILGDVRDRAKLRRAFRGTSVVIHAAALKRVESCERSPDEAADINVNGSRMVASAAFDTNVKKVLLVSTDKAVNPTNAMGATKLAAEKIYLAYNQWSNRPHFWVARLGNVLESRGSVLPTWREQAEHDKRIIVTNPDATRYFIKNEDVATFILDTLERPPGLYVPDCAVMRIGDLAKAFADKHSVAIEETELRPGERMNERLLSVEEAEARGLSPEQYQSDKAKRLNVSQIGELL